MSDTSAVLALPYIQPSQAQKHVTHNEALRVLDAAVQLAVETRDSGTPPVTAEVGARYIVGADASDDWAGHAGEIAVREAAGWHFITPRAGWQAFVIAESSLAVFDATSGWTATGQGSMVSVDTVGVNTGADSTNRLAVAADATLLTHAGAGHQLKLNKAGGADTASLLFQSNWTGHAEMGLAGNTDFSIKVSADGSAWAEALRVDAATAIPDLPQGVQIGGLVTGDAVMADAGDETPGRLMTVGAFGLGQTDTVPVVDLNSATTSGFYNFSGADAARPGTGSGAVIVARHSHSWINHLAFAPNKHELWLRYSKDNGATWADWVPVITNEQLVGTVSQVGGAPTGAVIERGTGPDGDYVRFADGTQICTQRVSVTATTAATGALFVDAGLTGWSFPAAFVAPPAVHMACEDSGAWADTGTVTATGAGRVLWSAAAISGTVTLHSTATGRWF